VSGDGADEGTTGGVASGAGMREMAGRRRVYTQNVRYQKIDRNGSRETAGTIPINYGYCPRGPGHYP